MTPTKSILECVPNFSEGRDVTAIEAIAEAIRSVPSVALLHIDASPAANRCVMTFAGSPDAVVESAYRSIRQAAASIDMRAQKGIHPRIGATDVCPFVPLHGCTMAVAIDAARTLGSRVGKELEIPVYLYEYAATAAYRKALPDIRSGQYERFAAKMAHDQWAPDFGPAQLNLQAGATVIGARDVLVAFNISLSTKEVSNAVWIAERLRERGYVKAEGGRKVRIPGALAKVRAIGWYMADYGNAQVSMNLLDYRVTSPLQVWLQTSLLAAEIGLSLTGSEVIGLIPEACLLEAGAYVYQKKGLVAPNDHHSLIYEAIHFFGLGVHKPFDPKEKVLEYALLGASMR